MSKDVDRVNLSSLVGVSRALSGGRHPNSLRHPFSQSSDRLSHRGFYDLRGLALRPYDAPYLSKLTSEQDTSTIPFLSALDAFGLILNQDALERMPGIESNVSYFLYDVILNEDAKVGRYDVDAFLITAAFIKDIFPHKQSILSTIEINPERLELARIQYHFYNQRLYKNADFISMVVDETRDPQALAHFISTAMGKKQDGDELENFLDEYLNSLASVGLALGGRGINKTLEEFKKNKNLESLGKILKEDRERVSKLYKKNQKIERMKKQLPGIEQGIKELQAKDFSFLSPKARRKTEKRLSKLERFQTDIQRELGQGIDPEVLGKTLSILNRGREILAGRKNKPSQSQQQHWITSFISEGHHKKSAEDGSKIGPIYTQYGQDLQTADRVGRQLSQLILSPRTSNVERMQEEGILDPTTLSSIVADSFGRAAERPYMRRQERFGRELDTAVTLLIDKSGSMSGDKIAMAYVAAERLAFWLITSGINVEVLSYTDDDYRVYKSFDDPFKPRESKHTFAGMLDGKHHGTPTGAGTIWAHDRLLRAPNLRKILMVLTDGGSTDSVDQVNDWIEAKSPVELVGFGIMHDVSKSYERAVLVEKPSDLIVSVAAQIKAMIDRPQESAHRIKRRPHSAAKAFDVKIEKEQKHSVPRVPIPS
jgi:hypothetical protein